MLIQKYGGALLATPELRKKVAENIISSHRKGEKVVAVISAMGRDPFPYSTDALLSLLNETGEQINQREKDLLLATGEIISVVVMAHLIRSLGAEAIALSGWQAGIVTDQEYGEAHIMKVYPEKIEQLLAEGKIPLVAGFQGVSSEGEITTLGRDGSDITALALGRALQAEKIEIYKDTPGIQTLNPALYSDSRVISRLTFEEAGEMADEGAKVLHKRCITLAKEYHIPVLVKALDSPENTLIEKNSSPTSPTSLPLEKDRVVTSLVDIPEIVQVKIDFSGDGKEKTRVFKALAQEKISLDVINICGNLLFFTIPEKEAGKVKTVLENLGVNYRIIPNLSKIALIGIGMKGTPGVMAKIQETLFKAGVSILHSTDSHITISCLVKREELEKAVLALKESFAL